ncbi:MAG: ABC transporter ATP-binding protein [Hyphomicrobiaceae bacterium]
MTLELKNISYRVSGDTHIYPTTLALVEGQFNTLLGTTLAGKTTLMQLMAGLIRPSEGEIWFGGRDVTGVPVQKRNVSMVYQQFINYPNLSVFENIASPLRVARLPRSEITDRVERMAELMQLSPMLGRKPSELSGGQQQRTAMARALVKDADLVLLDEPLANLDFKLREELRDELPKLFADRNCTVVYATTEPSEALLLGGQTAAMHEGSVVEFGPSGTIYRNPSSLLAAQVFSEPPINAIEVTKSGDEFVLSEAARWQANGKTSHLADGKYTIGIRPHFVSPAAADTGSVSIDGRVLITELSGSESVIHFDHAGETWVSQAHGIHAIEVGNVASFHFDAGHCLYFTPDGQRIDTRGET